MKEHHSKYLQNLRDVPIEPVLHYRFDYCIKSERDLISFIEHRVRSPTKVWQAATVNPCVRSSTDSPITPTLIIFIISIILSSITSFDGTQSIGILKP